MDAHQLLIMVEFALVVGIAGYVIADRMGLPAIVLLMGIGILVGPEVLNLVNPLALGTGLRVLVSIAVGIIVFEGGLLLDFNEMRAASPPIRNLITIGVVISVVGGTLVAWLIAGLPFELALLFGALMCVTGPTVITPLLKRANTNRRLTTILQSEAVLVDAIGAVLAVVVLEFILHTPEDPVAGPVREFVTRLGVGTLVGLVGGFLIVQALRYLSTLKVGTARLAALAGALAVFSLAEVLIPEAGIAAVALAGIVVGNMDIPYYSEIKSFKGDLTNLGIIMLFILLSAGLRFETFTEFSLRGWGGVLAVLALMVFVRPISIFVSMLGTSVPFKEQFYMSGLGPRGVVAASIALFAELELTANNYPGVGSFVGLVFMTIIGTVVIQGTVAIPLARRLGVTAMHVLIASADDIGRELARRLATGDMSVTLIDSNLVEVNQAKEEGLDARLGDETSSSDLRKAGIEQAAAFVAATPSDKTNLLACQIAMQRFKVENVSARVNKPENVENFTSLDIRVVSPVVSTAMLLDSLVRRSAVLELVASQVPGQEIREVTLESKKLVGKPLDSWEALRGEVLVAMIRRNGEMFVPHGNTILQEGDQLTLIGSCEDVEQACQQVE